MGGAQLITHIILTLSSNYSPMSYHRSIACHDCGKMVSGSIKYHHEHECHNSRRARSIIPNSNNIPLNPIVCNGQNKKKLTLEQRQYLLTQLQTYVSTIISTQMFSMDVSLDNTILEYINWNGIDPIDTAVCFVWVSHMFLPQDYTTYLEKGFRRPANLQAAQIVALSADGKLPFVSRGNEDPSLVRDLQRITHTHMTFCQRIQESEILQKVISDSNQLDIVFDEFERFLNLGYYWNGNNFCPTMIIDLIWHASMLDNVQYNKLMIGFMGKPLTHCLEENEGEDKQQERFTVFSKHFTDYHGKEPLNIDDLNLGEEKGVFKNLEQKYLFLQREKNEKHERVERIKRNDIVRDENEKHETEERMKQYEILRQQRIQRENEEDEERAKQYEISRQHRIQREEKEEEDRMKQYDSARQQRIQKEINEEAERARQHESLRRQWIQREQEEAAKKSRQAQLDSYARDTRAQYDRSRGSSC